MKKELLNKLVEQASAHASEQNERFGVSFKDAFNEKLAELIVKECADAIELNTTQIPKRSISEIRTILNQHFGVEK